VAYYPIFLDIADRRVVLIGGGEVILRKVQGLLEVGAEPTVVSPELHPDLALLVNQGRVRHEPRKYRLGDLKDCALAFVGTDDGSVNAEVAEEGRERGVWVNAVDDIPNCDFIMPGVARRSNITIAVSTGGGSPAMARKLREDLEQFLTEEYALLLEVATEIRSELRQKGIAPDSEVWNRALDSELKVLLAGGRRSDAKDRLLRALLHPVTES
jgi:precorrin-2 dehydrogenase/sirohydrochlorin ferrochelatase